MEYRNAFYSSDTGEITCEINHLDYGWIPHTVDDQVLKDQIILDNLITPYSPPTVVVSIAEINQERDRRSAGGFVFNLWPFDSDDSSIKRITGAATLAGFAMGAGAVAGNFLWHGGTNPFSWILSDNQIVQIDAPTMFAIGQAAARWESDHIFAARTLKDMVPLPLDYTTNTHWP